MHDQSSFSQQMLILFIYGLFLCGIFPLCQQVFNLSVVVCKIQIKKIFVSSKEKWKPIEICMDNKLIQRINMKQNLPSRGERSVSRTLLLPVARSSNIMFRNSSISYPELLLLSKLRDQLDNKLFLNCNGFLQQNPFLCKGKRKQPQYEINNMLCHFELDWTHQTLSFVR